MIKKLKIGVVCYPTYGGSGVIATELGIALSKKGHEVHFISYDQPFRLDIFSENIHYHEVLVPDYPLFEYAPYELNLTSKLIDVVLHEELNILHVHYAIPHASAAVNAQQILLTYGINIPIVTTLHGTDITLLGKDKSFKPVIEYAINKSNAVTVVSESLKKETLKYFNISKKINTISNFIEIDLYDKKYDVKLKNTFVNNEEYLITHISNFRKVKRVCDVIRIFKKVNSKIPSKLLMIGDGPDRIKAEILSRDLGIEDKVRFLGKINITNNILACSDVFILPSESESFGLVALEAMASRNAIVSTNNGGISELNIDKVTGFLSKVGDIQKMANDIILLLQNQDLLEKFKLNAFDHASNFDIHKVLPKYLNVYFQLCQH
ncbi:MAG: N-acetyl-alpha-D-glucosaminyl L-malate synthase BshA [Flavobacteriales bacterium]|nr:N-acetyl-alpha-D-glucosaminyl L-malate synthase BshA [Flavobacteriales bacterium]|tara:strand:+ start:46343 stop:47479 length:1137 start_codon:yes stop_codon:yes gene_type:complete